MNKYLMLSAAAVLASSASAYAGTHTFTFGTADGGAYCDGGTVNTDIGGNKAVRAWTHTNNNCASGTSEGQGLLGKVKGLGTSSEMSDTFYGKNYDIFSIQIAYTLPKKIANGQPWTLWVGEDGVTSFEGNSGTLVDVDGAVHRGTKSTAAAVKQLIAQHKN
jgi:hypothetical protein